MKNKGSIKIAVAGATGNVGQSILSILSERGFPAKNITALASERSSGRQVSYGEDDILTIRPLHSFDFSTTQIALFSPGGAVSAQYAPLAASQGCIVIDNTSHFRMEPDIPLVIPEINGSTIAYYKNKGIIANPNCSTIQLLMALKPLHDKAKIKRVVACTYQSVSGAGKKSMGALLDQTKTSFFSGGLGGNRVEGSSPFSKPIAFNVVPHIGQFMESGETNEEWKMSVETRKILDPSIQVVATCVRVPVLIGHGVAAHIEFETPISPKEAHQALKKFKGVQVPKEGEFSNFETPLEIAGRDEVYVSRIRQDPTVQHGLSLWVVSDNVRKGAALNAVQIAEELIEKHLGV